jgi:hypothetical protein
MKATGWTMIVFAIFVFFGGLFLPTSVETSLSSSYLPERVVNLGALQTQMIVEQSGLALFLAGVILAALGTIAVRAEQIFVEASPRLPDLLELLGGEEPETTTEVLNRHAIRTYGVKRNPMGGYFLGDASYYSLTDAISNARASVGRVA